MQRTKRRLAMWAASLCLLSAAVVAGENAGFEIVAHRARIHFLPSEQSLAVTDTVTIHKTRRDLEQLKMGLVSIYKIGRITINQKEIEPKRDRELLMIDDVPADSEFQMIVEYEGEFPFQSEFSQISKDRAIMREEDLLPQGPKALRFTRFSIEVPKEWEALTVGENVSREVVGDSATYVWQLDQPMPMIGWIYAGKFWKKELSGETPPISVHLFDEDSSSADGVLALARSAVQYYSEQFASYRFPRLKIVEVEDWLAGRNVLAVAMPSMIFVKKTAFTTDDPFNQVASILPHEIAHQWWPLTVFVAEEDLALLSEGMCEYSAYLFNENRGKMTRRDSLQHHPLLRSLIMRVMKGKDLPLQQRADLRSLPTHYLKASYVHNMLRHLLGDSTFLRLYSNYATRFALQNAAMKEFVSLAEELSGKKLEWFFDQWVKNRGMPRLKIYNVKSKSQEGKWVTRGRVRMVGYQKYTTVTEVGVETASGVTTASVRLGEDSSGAYKNDVGFEVTSDTKPSRALLDPRGDILKIQKLPVKFGDLREPADGIMIVGTLQHADRLLTLARSDSIAMDRSGWSISIKYDTSVTLADLQNDRVILYGKPSDNRIVETYVDKFPMGFRADSVVVNGEAIFDSTLALLQIIESPFISQGLWCWVAPLSEQAKPELLPIDASWGLVRGKDEISTGTWDVKDEDLVVEIPVD